MKGVILTSGLGSRLAPLTFAVNKNLVPIGALPMIEYPLFTLKSMGVKDVSIVTGREDFYTVIKYLGDNHPELDFSFHYQPAPLGVVNALLHARPSIEGKKFALIFGDNIFEDEFASYAGEFSKGAMVFLKEVHDPERFGIAELSPDKKRILRIKEKPINPKTNLAVPGFYFYDETVFDRISNLRPSGGGEYVITDLNQNYINSGDLNYAVVNGFWSDAGTHESLVLCNAFVRNGLEKRVYASLPDSMKERFREEVREYFEKDSV